MTQHEAQLNGYLVKVFYDNLRLEEASNRKGPCKNLSVSEMHVLEAVEKSSVDASGAAGMAEVAAHLSITSGTLSVAVKTLEQKGYLVRSRGSRDKRRVTAALTAAARSASRFIEASSVADTAGISPSVLEVPLFPSKMASWRSALFA